MLLPSKKSCAEREEPDQTDDFIDSEEQDFFVFKSCLWTTERTQHNVKSLRVTKTVEEGEVGT